MEHESMSSVQDIWQQLRVLNAQLNSSQFALATQIVLAGLSFAAAGLQSHMQTIRKACTHARSLPHSTLGSEAAHEDLLFLL